jgi:hypothetical protein
MRSHQKFPPILSFKKTININKNITNQRLKIILEPMGPHLFEVGLKKIPQGPKQHVMIICVHPT